MCAPRRRPRCTLRNRNRPSAQHCVFLDNLPSPSGGRQDGPGEGKPVVPVQAVPAAPNGGERARGHIMGALIAIRRTPLRADAQAHRPARRAAGCRREHLDSPLQRIGRRTLVPRNHPLVRLAETRHPDRLPGLVDGIEPLARDACPPDDGRWGDFVAGRWGCGDRIERPSPGSSDRRSSRGRPEVIARALVTHPQWRCFEVVVRRPGPRRRTAARCSCPPERSRDRP